MANTVSIFQTVSSALPHFMNLLQRTQGLIEKYNNFYGKDDGRCEFFVQWLLLNQWLFLQLDSFLEIFGRESDRVSKYFQFTEQDMIQFMDQFDTINRSCYCTKAMFNIENFLKSILEALEKKPIGYSTYRCITCMLENKLGLTPQQTDVLNCPALVRNSLHSNGNHTDKDFKMFVGGRCYKFEKGKQVMFAGWDNLYFMFNELLAVIDFILKVLKSKLWTKSRILQ